MDDLGAVLISARIIKNGHWWQHWRIGVSSPNEEDARLRNVQGDRLTDKPAYKAKKQPTMGWWRTRPKEERYDRTAHYSLIVSISTPDKTTDIYKPSCQRDGVPVEIAI